MKQNEVITMDESNKRGWMVTFLQFIANILVLYLEIKSLIQRNIFFIRYYPGENPLALPIISRMVPRIIPRSFRTQQYDSFLFGLIGVLSSSKIFAYEVESD